MWASCQSFYIARSSWNNKAHTIARRVGYLRIPLFGRSPIEVRSLFRNWDYHLRSLTQRMLALAIKSGQALAIP